MSESEYDPGIVVLDLWELWNIDTGNMIGTYDDEDHAVSAFYGQREENKRVGVEAHNVLYHIRTVTTLVLEDPDA